jgi:hypothetical protein
MPFINAKMVSGVSFLIQFSAKIITRDSHIKKENSSPFYRFEMGSVLS